MSLYQVYLVCLFVALFLAAIWSFLDKQKPPRVVEFVLKWLARSLVLFVLLMIVVGFFAFFLLAPQQAA